MLPITIPDAADAAIVACVDVAEQTAPLGTTIVDGPVSPTITVAVSIAPAELAIIVAIPLERARTFPETSIVAIFVFDEDHDTGDPFDPVALSVPVDPTASMSERSDVNVMPVESVIGAADAVEPGAGVTPPTLLGDEFTTGAPQTADARPRRRNRP